MKLYESLLRSPVYLLLFFVGIVVVLYFLYVAKMRNVDDLQGENKKGIAFYHEALNARLATLGPGHLDVAEAYDNLGDAYYNKRDYDKAIACYNKALDIRLEKLGEGDFDLVDSYNNLGDAYEKKGAYDKAIAYYNKVLAMLIEFLGFEDPITQAVQSKLNATKKKVGRA